MCYRDSEQEDELPEIAFSNLFRCCSHMIKNQNATKEGLLAIPSRSSLGVCVCV